VLSTSIATKIVAASQKVVPLAQSAEIIPTFSPDNHPITPFKTVYLIIKF
jgi:hypothetical protein